MSSQGSSRHTDDATTHPLFAACLNATWLTAASGKLFAETLILSGSPLNVTSSCLILVTTAGRIIAQRHRCGYQGFGGGKNRMPIVWRIHQARREAWMECNFDVSNKALLRISNCFLVTQAEDSWWGVSTCLVQLALLSDEQVTVDEQGIVTVGEVPLFSREQARDTQGCPELAPSPSLDHMRAGQYFKKVPIMHVLTLSSVLTAPSEWRACDWITLSMCRDLIEKFINGEDTPSTSRYFGCTPRHYAEQCTEFLSWWNENLGVIGRSKWPLLETISLYTYWADPEFRRATFADMENRS